jgi:restriction endonuclease S subunit
LSEIERYVDKVSEIDEKCNLYIELKLWRKAFDVAAKMKDSNKLVEVGI